MSYQELEARQRRIAHLHHVEAIVGWDEATMMPEGGGEARGTALATLRVLMHEMSTRPELGALFEDAEAERKRGALTHWQAANLRELRRAWIRATCLPADLVEASSRAESRCEQAWRKLRPQNDFATFAPLLSEVVNRKREVAAALAARLG